LRLRNWIRFIWFRYRVSRHEHVAKATWLQLLIKLVSSRTFSVLKGLGHLRVSTYQHFVRRSIAPYKHKTHTSSLSGPCAVLCCAVLHSMTYGPYLCAMYCLLPFIICCVYKSWIISRQLSRLHAKIQYQHKNFG